VSDPVFIKLHDFEGRPVIASVYRIICIEPKTRGLEGYVVITLEGGKTLTCIESIEKVDGMLRRAAEARQAS